MIRKKTLLFGCMAFLTLGIAVRFFLPPAFRETSGELRPAAPVIVLDAGHGGEDGGAVSPDGVVESHINLAIALNLQELFLFLGQETAMTRTADVSVHSPEAVTLREKKVSDLHNRVAQVNALPSAVLLSIHQNSLPASARVRGAQAFYGTVEPGAALACSIQAALNAVVNETAKTEKNIDKTIYLMKNVNCPAVLVECGFLSNREETAKLQSAAYQRTLAVTIAAGYLNTEK